MSPRSISAFAAALLVTPAVHAQITATVGASQDATIYWQAPGAANGAGEWLHAHFDSSLDVQMQDFLVRFDVAAALPAGATITSARIEVVCVEVFSTADFPLTAQRLTQPWTEGPSNPAGNEWTGVAAQPLDVTASHASWPSTPWTLPMIQPGLVSGAPIQPPGVWTLPTTPTLVSTVQQWLDQPATNFGLFFDTQEVARFASRENTSFAGPRLIVDYVPCPTPQNYCVAAPNSRGPGAIMGWSGSTSVAQNNFALTCSGGIPNGFGFFFFGDGQQQTPFGNGFVCVAGNVFRLLPGVNFNLAGVATRPVDNTAGVGTHLVAGTSWNFQIKYRDVAGGGALFNYSDGLNATFCP